MSIEPIQEERAERRAAQARAPRPVGAAVMRGLRRRCPACGVGTSFLGYLRLAPACAHCGEPLGHIRADDFPPYLTTLVVGHIVVPAVLMVEQAFAPPLALRMIAWPALALALTLAALPVIKGGVVGLMWALRLRGDERAR